MSGRRGGAAMFSTHPLLYQLLLVTKRGERWIWIRHHGTPLYTGVSHRACPDITGMQCGSGHKCWARSVMAGWVA